MLWGVKQLGSRVLLQWLLCVKYSEIIEDYTWWQSEWIDGKLPCLQPAGRERADALIEEAPS
eukprot:3531265-Amphidinium_carterae.1